MKNQLLSILQYELNYKSDSAQTTCNDLLSIEDLDIQQALNNWIQTREKEPVSAEGYDAVSLSRRMHYPSALLAIEMLRKEPEKAKHLLRGFR